MTRNQQMSSYPTYLEALAPVRLPGLEGSLRLRADFTKSGKILCLDRLTVPLTTGSITASQTTRERDFYA
jgi:hypothetical protein